jgi:hypothetical protein
MGSLGGCLHETISRFFVLKTSPKMVIRGSDVRARLTNSGSYWAKHIQLPFLASSERKTSASHSLWSKPVFFGGERLCCR